MVKLKSISLAAVATTLAATSPINNTLSARAQRAGIPNDMSWCEELSYLGLSPGETADEPCSCFNKGSGASHVDLDNAIKDFCTRSEGYVWRPNGGEMLKGLYPFVASQGTQTLVLELQIKLGWWADRITTPQDTSACNQEFVITYDQCVNGLHVPVDGCDTGGSDGKQGGAVRDLCLLWSIDPNPFLDPSP